MEKRRLDIDARARKTAPTRQKPKPKPRPDTPVFAADADDWNAEIDDDPFCELPELPRSRSPWPRWED